MRNLLSLGYSGWLRSSGKVMGPIVIGNVALLNLNQLPPDVSLAAGFGKAQCHRWLQGSLRDCRYRSTHYRANCSSSKLLDDEQAPIIRDVLKTMPAAIAAT